MASSPGEEGKSYWHDPDATAAFVSISTGFFSAGAIPRDDDAHSIARYESSLTSLGLVVAAASIC